jgi:hypothetical protein
MEGLPWNSADNPVLVLDSSLVSLVAMVRALLVVLLGLSCATSAHRIPEGGKDWSKGDTSWCINGTPLAHGECTCTREGKDACVGSQCESGYGMAFYPVSCKDCRCLPVAGGSPSPVPRASRSSDDGAEQPSCGGDVDNGYAAPEEPCDEAPAPVPAPPKRPAKAERIEPRHGGRRPQSAAAAQMERNRRRAAERDRSKRKQAGPEDEMDFDEWSRRMAALDSAHTEDDSGLLVVGASALVAVVFMGIFMVAKCGAVKAKIAERDAAQGAERKAAAAPTAEKRKTAAAGKGRTAAASSDDDLVVVSDSETQAASATAAPAAAASAASGRPRRRRRKKLD